MQRELGPLKQTADTGNAWFPSFAQAPRTQLRPSAQTSALDLARGPAERRTQLRSSGTNLNFRIGAVADT